MQAWGSILALPLSLGAMIFTGLLLFHEVRVRRQERYHNDSAQARLVRIDSAIHDDGSDHSTARIKYWVSNRSGSPVFDLQVLHPSKDGDTWDAPSRTITVVGGERGAYSIVDPSLITKLGEKTAFVHSLDLPYLLVFTDAEGRRWSRDRGAGLPRRAIRELAPISGSIIGLLSELWSIGQKRQALMRWLGSPRRLAKGWLRRAIWKRRQVGIDNATKAIQEIMRLQAMAAERPHDSSGPS
jgi:hypothetical protein